jgi:hypothetical protein
MQTVGERSLLTLLAVKATFRHATNGQIRKQPGTTVKTFQELVEKVARLSFYNPEHILLLRGQTHNYNNVRVFAPLSRDCSDPDAIVFLLSHPNYVYAMTY